MTDPKPEVTRAVAVPLDPQRAVPTKCVACDHEMNTAVVCDYCHTLNPISSPTDYFQLLGIPRSFRQDGDDLRRRYLALNRHAHPDFHTGDTTEAQQLALTVASAVNDAYRTLNDPISRAAYLVELLGGKSSADDRAVPDGFLAEMMTLREELSDAKTQGDRQAADKMAGELESRLAGMVDSLGKMFAEFESTFGCEAIRLDGLGRIRRQLNAISYIRRLIEVAKSK
jgi:molecular chaperone HscB